MVIFCLTMDLTYTAQENYTVEQFISPKDIKDDDFVRSGSFGKCTFTKDSGTVTKQSRYFFGNGDGNTLQLVKIDYLCNGMTCLAKEALVMQYLNKRDNSTEGFLPRLLSFNSLRYESHAKDTIIHLVPTLVLQYVGIDLTTFCIKNKNFIDIGEFLLQTLGALQFLDQHGVIHCDITLSNITFEREINRFKLIDFGAAEFDDANIMHGMGFKQAPQTSGSDDGMSALATDVNTTSDTYLPYNTVLHFQDVEPKNKSIRVVRQTNALPYFDVGIALSMNPKLERYCHSTDCYSLACVAIFLTGLPLYCADHDLSNVILYTTRALKKDTRLFRLFHEHLTYLCKSVVSLRGPLTFEESAIWWSLVNDDPYFTDLMVHQNPLRTLRDDFSIDSCKYEIPPPPLLDRTTHLYGENVVKILKSMLHPIRHYRMSATEALEILENHTVVPRNLDQGKTLLIASKIESSLVTVLKYKTHADVNILIASISIASPPTARKLEYGPIVVEWFNILSTCASDGQSIKRILRHALSTLVSPLSEVSLRFDVRSEREWTVIQRCMIDTLGGELTSTIRQSNVCYFDIDIDLSDHHE